MFELKPDFEDVLNCYGAWWECAIVDRPLVSIAFDKPRAERQPLLRKDHVSIRDRWMDTEYIVRTAETNLRNTVHCADSLPVAWPNLGPEGVWISSVTGISNRQEAGAVLREISRWTRRQ